MYYYNNIPTYQNNMYGMRNQYQRPIPNRPGNRPFGGGFLLPFALGFVSSPLIFGAANPRPPFYGPYPPPPPYYRPYPYR